MMAVKLYQGYVLEVATGTHDTALRIFDPVTNRQDQVRINFQPLVAVQDHVRIAFKRRGVGIGHCTYFANDSEGHEKFMDGPISSLFASLFVGGLLGALGFAVHGMATRGRELDEAVSTGMLVGSIAAGLLFIKVIVSLSDTKKAVADAKATWVEWEEKAKTEGWKLDLGG